MKLGGRCTFDSPQEILMCDRVWELLAWWVQARIWELEKPRLGYQLCHLPGWVTKKMTFHSLGSDFSFISREGAYYLPPRVVEINRKDMHIINWHNALHVALNARECWLSLSCNCCRVVSFKLNCFSLQGYFTHPKVELGPHRWISKSSAPEPINIMLFGKRVFADVIKWRILRWDHLALGWALNPMTNPCKRQQRRRPCEHRDRNWSDVSTRQGMPRIDKSHRKVAERCEMGFPSVTRRSWPCWHLDLRLLASRTCCLFHRVLLQWP